MRYRSRFGLLISGRGSNMQALVRAVRQDHIPADIAFVGSDNPQALGLIWAREQGIETFVVDYQSIFQRINSGSGPTRSLIPRIIAEMKLLEQLKRYDFDLLCLAGFMRILTSRFIDVVSPNPDCPSIMNIHPSLLPAFPGVDGYGNTLRYGCRVGGCTVHFVDKGKDTGPIIGQRTFVIESSDTLDSICTKGLKLEHQLYPLCVRLFFEGRLQVKLNSAGHRIVFVQ